MVHLTSTRWAALGAAILLAPLSRSVLADDPVQTATRPAPVFIARQPAPANAQPVPAQAVPAPPKPAPPQPAGTVAPNPQQGAVIIYLPAGSQPADLQALLAGASTPPVVVGRHPGPMPEQFAPARPSGPVMPLPQPRQAAPAPAPGLPVAHRALLPAHGSAVPLETHIANFVTNPPPRTGPVVATPVAQPQADSTVQTGEARQRALIPASSLPLKINESTANRGFFEWPEGMKSKSEEEVPVPQSPMAKRTRAIFRSPELPQSESDQQQAVTAAAATKEPEQAPRPRALFSQRPEAPTAAPPVVNPAPARVAPRESTSVGPYAPEPPRVHGAPQEPMLQSPVHAAAEVSAKPQAAPSTLPSAPVSYSAPQAQTAPPQPAQPRALFGKPVDDRPAVLTVAEQILGPNVLPPSTTTQGQAAPAVAAQSTAPAGRPKAKALFPKSMFTRAKPGEPREADPLKKYLPTNYPAGGAPQVAASAPRHVPQPTAAPAVAATSGGPSHSRSLFPLKFFGQQPDPDPSALSPSAGQHLAQSNQTPTLAAAPANDETSDITRPNLQPMSAAAPGTSLALPSEGDGSTSGNVKNEPIIVANKAADREAIDEGDWRPSKRRRKPTTAQKAKVAKSEPVTAKNSEPTLAATSEERPTRQSETSASQSIVKIEKAAKPTPAVIVPLADPLPAAPTPIADGDDTPLNNARDIDTAVKRSSATEPDTASESAAVATDTLHKRRPVIIRPEKHEHSDAKRLNPVRVIRGGSDADAGPVADITDDEGNSDSHRKEVTVSSASAKRSNPKRPAPRGFDPSAVRSNPLR